MGRTLAVLALVASPLLASTGPLRADLLPPEQENALASFIPRYDARKDASFDEIRSDLLATIASKDSVAPMVIFADDIRISFVDTNGKQAFVGQLTPADPKSKVWPVLDLVMKDGGVFATPSEFVAPYVYVIWPKERDAFEYVAVVAPTAKLRLEPNADALVVAPLSYEIVAIAEPSGLKPQGECSSGDWVRVRRNGDEGYVMCGDVRSSIDYRALFERKAGRWMMTTLVAGD